MRRRALPLLMIVGLASAALLGACDATTHIDIDGGGVVTPDVLPSPEVLDAKPDTSACVPAGGFCDPTFGPFCCAPAVCNFCGFCM